MPSARHILTRYTTVRAGASAVLLSLSLALPVFAQYQNNDGRALDRNLQHGSGGGNAPTGQVDYRARNYMVTGNVPGLGYFHDSVGYGSTGDFSGNLGSDSLYRFRAQSLSNYSPAAVATGLTSSYGVYRSFAPTDVGDIRRGAGSLIMPSIGVSIRPGNSSRATPFDDLQSTGSTLDFSRPALLSVEGKSVTPMTLSPLLGVRRLDVSPSTENALKPSPSGSDTSSPGSVPGNTLKPAPSGPDFSTPANPAAQLTLAARLPVTLELGAQVQSLIAPERADNVMSLDQRLAQIEAAMFSPLGSAQAKPGDDVYMDILTRVRANTQAAKGMAPTDKPADQLTPAPEPTPDKPAVAPDTPLLPMPTIEPPATEKLAEAARLREEALRKARGLTTDKPESADTGKNDQGISRLDLHALLQAPDNDPQKAQQARRLAKFIESLKQTGPALATLAGRRQGIVDDLLRRAEVDLREDKYFDAEIKYRQALELAPNQPLVRIGMVHTQLGAGLVRSAAYNLRNLFEQHPELIAVRYQAHLLPGAKRVPWIRAQLMDTINLSQSRTEPALLLAYLGYQYENPQLVSFGLDLAQARAPRDPLWPILRELWLKSPAPTASSATSPAPSAPKSDEVQK